MDPVAYIIQQARRRNLDPNAVLAVARQEGLGGGVGDRGTSFGPWQLHQGGALPRGIRNPQQWAWSPQGINYALDRIAGVAAGRRGRAAIQAIVTGFERPANPGREIQGALGAYGRGAATRQPLARLNTLSRTAIGSPPPPAGRPGVDVNAIVNMTHSIVGLPEVLLPTFQQPVTRAPRRRQQQNVALGQQPGLRPPRRNAPTVKYLEHFAAPYGVQVTSTTSGNHVAGSYHYRGRAVDFGGDAHRMAALARAALQHPQAFAEMFYTGPGHPNFYIKNGQVIPLSKLDRSVYANHHDHVHLAA